MLQAARPTAQICAAPASNPSPEKQLDQPLKLPRACVPTRILESYKAMNVIGHYAPELERKTRYQHPRAKLAIRLAGL
jgi:hypothetical protein